MKKTILAIAIISSLAVSSGASAEKYKITAYNDSMTALGKRPIQGVTIASDWSVLPKGTRVWIEGIGVRTVQDNGGGVKGKHIDLYMPAWMVKKFGVKYREVKILGR